MTEQLMAATMMENAAQLMAEIEGMKQANIDRERQGKAPAYSEEDFYSAANKWKANQPPNVEENR